MSGFHLSRRTTHLMQLIVIGQSLLLVVASAPSGTVLEKYARKFAEQRQKVHPRVLEISEGFGKEIGMGMMYEMELNTMSGDEEDVANFAALQLFRKKVVRLDKKSDADATIEFLRSISPTINYTHLTKEESAMKLVSGTIAHSCQKFVDAIKKEIFDKRDLIEADQSGQLAKECDIVGGSRLVKNFVLGWAHYHVCELILAPNQPELYRNIAVRANDKLETSMKYGYSS